MAFRTKFVENVKEHVQEQHKNVNGKWQCFHCAKLHKKLQPYKNHLKTHKSAVLQCRQCLYTTNTMECLRIHVKRHFGVKKHKCDCGKMFLTVAELKAHSNTHSEEQNFKCTICSIAMFNQKSNLDRHIKSVHRKREDFHRCEKCSASFNLKQNLQRHLKNVHKWNVKWWILSAEWTVKMCTFCNSFFLV